MELKLVTEQHVKEAVMHLSKTGSLPFTGADGKPNHRLMGAAWAALHSGYRGNKYEGDDKDAALDKLKAVYKAQGMDAPQESFDPIAEFFEEALKQDDSFNSMQQKVTCAIQTCIRAGEDMDCDGDGPKDVYDYAYVVDLFPNTAVYQMNSKLFQVDYTIKGDKAIIGSPSPVEMTYTPSTETTSAAESARVLVAESLHFEESAYDATKGKLTITVIKPGMSKNKRFYSESVLKKHFGIFAGAKMFSDHQTEAESKAKPEGSIKNWVATIEKPWVESDGTVMATAIVCDPTFKAKLDLLNSNKQLNEMGISIRAIGEASDGEVDGAKCKIIESLLHARSVDFVTMPAAGGRVEALEAEDTLLEENDIELVSEETFRTKRKDLVTLIETKILKTNKETANMSEYKQQFEEANAKLVKATADLAEATTKLSAANAKIEESEKAARIATAASELSKMIVTAKLPDMSAKQLKKQFVAAESVDGMQEAVTEHADYIKSLGIKRNNGATEVGTVAESVTAEATQKRLVSSYKSMGMSEDQAKIAAGV